ncbi:signal transduction histidine kinase [Actinokineospora baliensis]|uniref:sensor histidine kinase n=1 Tax=Actinokineospora baliensis TaxID=547056 RepID=UPI00195D3F2C|nr:sensor histidine kinase [Actinokineospora baliensis]MBM7773186.1 signal transduction histidine kinase [Actinokineospora baliensis]
MSATSTFGRLDAVFARGWPALRYLLLGGLTAMMALIALSGLVVVTILCLLFGLGLPAVPEALRMVRRLANLERRRIGRRLDLVIPEPYRPLSGALRTQLRTLALDPATRRDAAWLVLHCVTGTLLGALAIGLASESINGALLMAYWWWVPETVVTSFGIAVTSWGIAWLCLGISLGCITVALLVLPPAARWQANFGHALLRPAKGVVLSDQVAELTASRAAALDAHGVELRRIERDLHDGTQARIAAVIMQLGIVGQLRTRDPDAAFAMVEKAQDTALSALTELRDVVRSIYPPILSDRGLDGAVTALAARCPIPCVLAISPIGRQPAAVEAAAYFIIAEALTNATKHSGATTVTVALHATPDTVNIEITDNGHGGADESQGTGLTGIRRRADAFDGRTDLTSPPGGPTVLRVTLPRGR